MYIDLAYYLDNGGEVMTDAAFSRCEFRARKILDRYTSGRVRQCEEIPEAVKRLMVELVSLEATQGAAVKDSQAVSSFSNDGYTETIADPLTTDKVAEIERDLIYEYLYDERTDNGIPMLYLGVV